MNAFMYVIDVTESCMLPYSGEDDKQMKKADPSGPLSDPLSLLISSEGKSHPTLLWFEEFDRERIHFTKL